MDGLGGLIPRSTHSTHAPSDEATTKSGTSRLRRPLRWPPHGMAVERGVLLLILLPLARCVPGCWSFS